jgi:hypothetical protein
MHRKRRKSVSSSTDIRTPGHPMRSVNDSESRWNHPNTAHLFKLHEQIISRINVLHEQIQSYHKTESHPTLKHLDCHSVVSFLEIYSPVISKKYHLNMRNSRQHKYFLFSHRCGNQKSDEILPTVHMDKHPNKDNEQRGCANPQIWSIFLRDNKGFNPVSQVLYTRQKFSKKYKTCIKKHSAKRREVAIYSQGK